MTQRTLNIEAIQIPSAEALEKTEKDYRRPERDFEQLALTHGTSFKELANTVFRSQSRDAKLMFFISNHKSVTGSQKLCEAAANFLAPYVDRKEIQILYIAAGMDGDQLKLKLLLRIYNNRLPKFKDLFDTLGDDMYFKPQVISPTEGKLLIPDDVKNFHITEEQEKEHKQEVEKQNNNHLLTATKEKPFLNQIDTYVPTTIVSPIETEELVYDMMSDEKKIKIITSYEKFNAIFDDVMDYVHGVERNNYLNTITPGVFADIANGDIERGQLDPQQLFMTNVVEKYIRDRYVKTGKLPNEDLPQLLAKLHKALYEFYIIQDMIDNPDITDIKVTGPNSIRVRIHGDAYLSNVNFIDARDLREFAHYIAIRNGINEYIMPDPFTDESDPNYILRISYIPAFANSVPWPYLHIRKVDRKKPLAPELIQAHMLTPKIRDYLLDCGRNSRGVVFCGPPGSGKTVALNWFLEEAYEKQAEILVIQESDELFANRKGVMLQHVVHTATDEHDSVTLEELGQRALVAGANVFIIGEVKGAEICSAITLANSGCRVAMTIHSNSASEATEKMANLAMRGYGALSPEQTKRELMPFQTLVFLKDFKVVEITEVTGYDYNRKDLTYRYIYEYNKDLIRQKEDREFAERRDRDGK